MSYEVTYDENISNQTQRKNLIVNGKYSYKIHMEKDVFRKNAETGLEYTLDIKCAETGVNIQAVLPHEVLIELNDMIGKSLEF